MSILNKRYPIQQTGVFPGFYAGVDAKNQASFPSKTSRDYTAFTKIAF
jgi:hypothetical protein